MRLLHATSRRSRLARRFCGELLTWRFATSRLTRRLLRTGHFLSAIGLSGGNESKLRALQNYALLSRLRRKCE